MDAFTQLTVRYRRDIPEIFKYNAFVVICDGANSKYGSLFSQYDFFYAWRKVNDEDPEMDGINSLYTMIDGMFDKNRLLEYKDSPLDKGKRVFQKLISERIYIN